MLFNNTRDQKNKNIWFHCRDLFGQSMSNQMLPQMVIDNKSKQLRRSSAAEIPFLLVFQAKSLTDPNIANAYSPERRRRKEHPRPRPTLAVQTKFLTIKEKRKRRKKRYK